MFKKLIVKDALLQEVLIERVSPTECRTVKVLRQRLATAREQEWFLEGNGRLLDFDKEDGGFTTIRIKPL